MEQRFPIKIKNEELPVIVPKKEEVLDIVSIKNNIQLFKQKQKSKRKLESQPKKIPINHPLIPEEIKTKNQLAVKVKKLMMNKIDQIIHDTNKDMSSYGIRFSQIPGKIQFVLS